MKWWSYLICACLVIAGIVCGALLVEDYTERSSIHGEGFILEYEQQQEQFNFRTNSFDLYENAETGIFEYLVSIEHVKDFNGAENNYELTINDSIIVGTWGAGYFVGSHSLAFYDIDASLLDTCELDITIKFYKDKTDITFSTDSIAEEKLISDYYTNYGFIMELEKLGGN